MIEKLKQLPTSVLLAMGCLFFVWVLMMVLAPAGTIGFTVIVLTIASAVRVISYLTKEL